MTNKRYKWHTHWRAEGGRVVHDSGLIFTQENGEWLIDTASIDSFRASELSRGVPAWQHDARIETLKKEATRWASDPRNMKKND